MPERSAEELLEQILDVQLQNQRWLRILARDEVKETIESEFSKPWEYHVYDALDGNTSTRELADEFPVHDTTIAGKLKKWRQLGITVKTESGQYDKVTSLELLGIEPPEINENG